MGPSILWPVLVVYYTTSAVRAVARAPRWGVNRNSTIRRELRPPTRVAITVKNDTAGTAAVWRRSTGGGPTLCLRCYHTQGGLFIWLRQHTDPPFGGHLQWVGYGSPWTADESMNRFQFRVTSEANPMLRDEYGLAYEPGPPVCTMLCIRHWSETYLGDVYIASRQTDLDGDPVSEATGCIFVLEPYPPPTPQSLTRPTEESPDDVSIVFDGTIDTSSSIVVSSRDAVNRRTPGTTLKGLEVTVSSLQRSSSAIGDVVPLTRARTAFVSFSEEDPTGGLVAAGLAVILLAFGAGAGFLWSRYGYRWRPSVGL